MSASADIKTLTPPDIAGRKGAEPIACLTAYTTPMARLVDRHCDVVLVGDSVGMVLHGLPSTLGVSLEMMIMHGKAVRRGVERALMVVDMPFGSYEESPEQAFRNAARLMAETGCAAVKLEGGELMAGTVRFLAGRGIPVMAHVGLTPQSVNVFGGYKVQGRGDDADRIAARCGRCHRGRRVFGRAGKDRRAAGARHHRKDRGANHRHRRFGSLRRPDPGG